MILSCPLWPIVWLKKKRDIFVQNNKIALFTINNECFTRTLPAFICKQNKHKILNMHYHNHCKPWFCSMHPIKMSYLSCLLISEMPNVWHLLKVDIQYSEIMWQKSCLVLFKLYNSIWYFICIILFFKSVTITALVSYSIILYMHSAISSSIIPFHTYRLPLLSISHQWMTAE